MENFEIDNFIYTKSNALSKEDCEAIIKDGINYDDLSSEFIHLGSTQFPQKKLGRDDVQLFIPQTLPQWFKPIQKCIFEGFDEYVHYVSSVAQMPIISPGFKWQRTNIGGGYSVWHIEQGPGSSSSRILVWSIYLNDVNEGGETEFLYQHRKIKPETGKLVIWPAGVTHPHRGNPPYSNEKFILTGWFVLPENDIYADLLNGTDPRSLDD